jgi:hypothetical protein
MEAESTTSELGNIITMIMKTIQTTAMMATGRLWKKRF